MSNGYSTEQMLDKIYDELVRHRDLIAELKDGGCSHRADDVKRVDRLETWRDWLIVGIIGLAVGLVVELLVK